MIYAGRNKFEVSYVLFNLETALIKLLELFLLALKCLKENS